MRYKVAIALVLLILAGGFVLALVRPQGIAWRVQLVRQKVSGDGHGLSWAELGASMFPASWGVRRLIDPGPDHWIRKLNYPLQQAQPWKLYRLFADRTSCLDSFDTHFTVLQGGAMPHNLHQHSYEEIIVPMSGEVDILRAKDGAGANQTTERVGYGRFIYHASNDFHTIRAVGPLPSSYLVFSWSSAASKRGSDNTLRSSTFEFDASGSGPVGAGFKMKVLFESPTLFLNKLHAHYSTMQPGAGYAAHDDPYDVAVVVLDGTVETIGHQVSAPSVIFYSAHKPHGMRNPGNVPARYLVFEFHGCNGAR